MDWCRAHGTLHTIIEKYLSKVKTILPALTECFERRKWFQAKVTVMLVVINSPWCEVRGFCRQKGFSSIKFRTFIIIKLKMQFHLKALIILQHLRHISHPSHHPLNLGSGWIFFDGFCSSYLISPLEANCALKYFRTCIFRLSSLPSFQCDRQACNRWNWISKPEIWRLRTSAKEDWKYKEFYSYIFVQTPRMQSCVFGIAF